jgi:hypothetical protein
MQKSRTALIAIGIAGSFIGLAVAIIVMSTTGVITHTVAKLMLVALVGLYLGFGFLIAVYQLLRKLD